MNDDLRSNSNLPTSSPYTDGLTCDSDVFNSTGDDAIVDWVFIELRDASDRSIIVESRSALLQRDGDIVDIDGVSSVSLASSKSSYYVLVGHRNHISILSAAPIPINTSTVIDLSADPIAVYGNNNAVNAMSDNKYAMIGGDFDGNGQIQNSDETPIIILLGNSGYDAADLDLNGQIQNTDITNLLAPNLGKGIQY